MTQPEPTDLPSVPAEEVMALEEAAVAATVGGLAAVLTPVLAGLLVTYEALGALAAVDLRDMAVQRLGGLTWPDMNVPAHDYGVRGQLMGVRRGADEAGTSSRGVPLESPDSPDLNAAAQARLDDAVRLARTLPLDTKANVMAVIGRASSARSMAEGTTRAVVYGGVSKGKVAVAKAARLNLLWVPERDACLHCLAHAGWVWKPGTKLPAGLTYSDKPLKDRVRYPPLHPNCRCEAVVTDLPTGAPPAGRSGVNPATRLAAEARRSVVYGWTDHASQAATLRAMDRLLKQGADLPTTVEQRARAAVRAGRTVRRPK